MSTYSDYENKWLVKPADEDRRRRKGFMNQLKRQWGQNYPDKTHVSKQNLRDIAARFRKKVNMNAESDMGTGRENGELERKQESTRVKENKNTRNSKLTNEIKMHLLRVEEHNI